MNDVRSALADATARLSATSDSARLDAELLMASALGVTREAMLLRSLDAAVPETFAALVARRLTHEPLAYITGTRDFWTISLGVTPDVLIPRPDSETLIEAALAHFGATAPATVLDLGTGSGALLLAALAQWPGATGLGVDASPAALEVAVANAARLGFAPRARFALGDWGQGIAERFDLILCNPPYVESGAALAPDVVGFEPALALFAGHDGLDAYRRLLPQLGTLLEAGGMIALEVGIGQAGAVRQLAVHKGFVTNIVHDLAGRDRCVALTLVV
jgi:release factor glutamine methyltransferase